MKYRIKSAETGQLGWQLYDTAKEAKRAAKASNVKAIAVDERGAEIKRDYRYTRRNDSAQAGWDRINFPNGRR